MTQLPLGEVLQLVLGVLIAILLAILLAWLILNGLMFLLIRSTQSKSRKSNSLPRAPERRTCA